MQIGVDELCATHLQFADDTVNFCEGETQEVYWCFHVTFVIWFLGIGV